jgi:hypothetical protein
VDLQTNTFDTSGQLPLSLGDTFGSLRVEGCLLKSCKRVLCYEVCLNNGGSTNLNVTDFALSFNNGSFDLLDLLNQTFLSPDQSVSLQRKFEVSICSGQVFVAGAKMEVTSGSGEICQVNKTLSFTVPTGSITTTTASSAPVQAPHQAPQTTARESASSILTTNAVSSATRIQMPGSLAMRKIFAL